MPFALRGKSSWVESITDKDKTCTEVTAEQFKHFSSQNHKRFIWLAMLFRVFIILCVWKRKKLYQFKISLELFNKNMRLLLGIEYV